MRGRCLTFLIMPIVLAVLYQSRSALFRTWSSAALLSRLSRTSNLEMSTFQHPEYNIPITLPAGLSQSQLLNFHPFTSWLSTLQASLSRQRAVPTHPFHADPYALRAVTVQSHDFFGGARLGFVKLTAHVANGAGETLPGAVFLRGPSVAMLVMLLPEDGPGDVTTGQKRQQPQKEIDEEEEEEEERHVLLTVQPRVAAGSLEFVELPAGMVDEAGNFAGQAAREIYEELGMEIRADELVSLSELVGDRGPAAQHQGQESQRSGKGDGGDGRELLARAVYPSPGACDEYIPIYMHERRVPRAQLGEWTGKLTGLREHGEKITLKLVRMRDLWKVGARDAKCLAAVALWKGLRREGKV